MIRHRRQGRNGTIRDKFRLYQESVQNTEFEVYFMRRTFTELRGRIPMSLREDFCGSAALACEWVRRVEGGTAVGVDLDGPTLEYAREHNVAALGDRAAGVTLVRRDVLEPGGEPVDVVVAYNFSYFIFKSRDVLLTYFRRVRESLHADGVFFLDIYGGPEAQAVQEEKTRQQGFTYVWDQARYNPITGESLCHIHFDFPDGSRMKRAFTYDWRLWSLPEVADLLVEAGFETPQVFWEGTDRTNGGGNGVFRRSVRGDNSLSWVAYVVACV